MKYFIIIGEFDSPQGIIECKTKEELMEVLVDSLIDQFSLDIKNLDESLEEKNITIIAGNEASLEFSYNLNTKYKD